MNSRGNISFSLVIAAVLLGSALSSLSLIDTSNKKVSYLALKAEQQELLYEIDYITKKLSICTCQMSSTSPEAGTKMRINTTITTPQTIILDKLRTSCDFVTPNNILVQTGSQYSNFFKIKSIGISDIVKGDADFIYTANLR